MEKTSGVNMESIPMTDGLMKFPGNSFSTEEVKKLPDLGFLAYMKLVEPIAFEITEKTGIYYLVPIIQSAHESRNGNSGLARNYCNLFGIVATDSWKKNGGEVANLDTWEEIKGKRVDMKREFRAYKTWRDSFFDWARIITTLSVYKQAYELLKKKETVPEGLEKMGLIYASDTHYSRKLKDLYSQVTL